MVAYAYPVENQSGFEHHERFATTLNRLVEAMQSNGMTEGEAVTLTGFVGMSHLDAAKEGNDFDSASMVSSVYNFYQKAGIEKPKSFDVENAVQFFQRDIQEHGVDLHQVADYVFGSNQGSGAEQTEDAEHAAASEGVTGHDLMTSDAQEPGTGIATVEEPTSVLEPEIVDDMPEDMDIDAEHAPWQSPGRRHPDLSDHIVALLRNTAMAIRMPSKPQKTPSQGSGSLLNGILKPFKVHMAHNRARHLEDAAHGLREFDRLVERGPAKGQSFADHESELKDAAKDFLKHAQRGLSQPGLSTAVKNGVDPKNVEKLQDAFDAWKSLNGDLLEKMKLDQLAGGIAKAFSSLFSKRSSTSNIPS